jgi:peptide methionine sulfoxide reductase MsrA
MEENFFSNQKKNINTHKEKLKVKFTYKMIKYKKLTKIMLVQIIECCGGI